MMKTRIAALLLALGGLPPAMAASPFTVSADGKEVTDTRSNLVWRRCAEGMAASTKGCAGKALGVDHDGAIKRAEAQAKASGVAWRLPSNSELRGIADESRFKLAIDTEAFPGTPPQHFWTSERINKDYANAVHFYNGFHYDRYHTNEHHVRLVRSAR